MLTLSSHILDALLSEPAQTEPGTPVRHLSDSDSVDTSVDTRDTFFAVDVGKNPKGGLGLYSGSSLFMTSDLNCLHACAEAHSSIRLGNTADDTSRDTSGKVPGAESSGMVSVNC